ncbi:MAG: hypothetical protein GX575_22070 [Candidatus Anammoximicrobium sp.]|nr:hypothetical protein [Candidatus Anammoximicrobium sp.]
MLRSLRPANWLSVVLAVLCAVQGTSLGTAHHLCCGHPSHVHHLVNCHGWHDGCVPKDWQWDHRHPAPVSPAHDAHNCLACRYVAERGLLPRTIRVEDVAVFVEPLGAVAPMLLIAAVSSSYDCRAPPV